MKARLWLLKKLNQNRPADKFQFNRLSQQPTVNFQMINILIVDDDPQSTWSISRLLESMGYQAWCLLESEFLFDMLAKRKMDLILLDISMPGTNTRELLQNLKAHSKYRSIPVVMLTDRNEEYLEDCIKLGALDFISKPVQKAGLRARIRLISGEPLNDSTNYKNDGER